MTEREKLITAIERARERSEEFGLDIIIVKHKETDLILKLLKEQEAVKPVVNQDEWVCGCCGLVVEQQRMIHPGAIFHDFFEYCPHCGKKVDWKAVDPDADEG